MSKPALVAIAIDRGHQNFHGSASVVRLRAHHSTASRPVSGVPLAREDAAKRVGVQGLASSDDHRRLP